jgi:hypothetical protein
MSLSEPSQLVGPLKGGGLFDSSECDGCAHCVDLVTPTPHDAPTLVAARARVHAFVAERLLAP